jgi:hypothetical protein
MNGGASGHAFAARPGSMRGSVGELLAGQDRVSDECARLLKQLQTRCPGVLPGKPLEPGAVGPEIPLSRDELQKLVSVAVITAAGLPAGTDAGQVVWSQAGNELLVLLAKVAVQVDHGIALVDIPISCDQSPNGSVTVAFAVGDDRRPAGMLAVTEDRPRGPRVVVDVWGEALTAFAWQMLLTVCTGVAGGVGEDVDGAPLIPAAVAATGNRLRILTMARHTFDRVIS